MTIDFARNACIRAMQVNIKQTLVQSETDVIRFKYSSGLAKLNIVNEQVHVGREKYFLRMNLELLPTFHSRHWKQRYRCHC